MIAADQVTELRSHKLYSLLQIALEELDVIKVSRRPRLTFDIV